MLLEVKLVPSKRPWRESHRKIFVMRCDHCSRIYDIEYQSEKDIRNQTHHFCDISCKYASQSNGILAMTIVNPFTKEDVKEKIRQTNIIKYGVENAAQSDIVKEHTKQTCLDRFGVDAPMKSSIIRDKSVETCIEKYGVENVAQSSIVQAKIRETNVQKYGTEYAGYSNAAVLEKIKKTNIERYGIEDPGWMIGITKHKKGYVSTQWGELYYRSSWEEKFLLWCNGVATNVKPNIQIAYDYEGKRHHTYVDFLIEMNGQNLLCEIKPAKLAQFEKNTAKFLAAREWCKTNNAIFVHIDEYALADLSVFMNSVVLLFT